MITFNKDRMGEFITDPKPAEGQHVGMIIECFPHQSKKDKNDNIMAQVVIKKLTDAEDPESVVGPKARLYCTLPLDNPDVEGHRAPVWSPSMLSTTASAFSDAVVAAPRFDPELGAMVFCGEVLESKKAVLEAKYEACEKAGEFAAEWWGDDGDNLDSIVGTVVYYSVTYKEGSDFPSIQEIYSECPDHWVITDQVVRSVEGLDEEEYEAPKTTKKKKTKKRGKK